MIGQTNKQTEIKALYIHIYCLNCGQTYIKDHENTYKLCKAESNSELERSKGGHHSSSSFSGQIN